MRLFFIILILAALTNFPASAQEKTLSPQVMKETDAIMGSLMSPYCPGRLLKDCPSGQAFELKDKIAARLQSGEPSEAVVADLINTFGDEIRAAPEAKGFGIVAWLAPGMFLCIGGVLIFLWLKSRSQSIDKSITPLSPELEERLKSELR